MPVSLTQHPEVQHTTDAQTARYDARACREEARTVDARAALERGAAAMGVHPAAVALAILRDASIPLDEIRSAARRAIATRTPQLHTFVPLYITNHCDSECKMCGMRSGNDRLLRKFAGKHAIEEQLRILYAHEKVRGVGILTGEYRDEYTRLSNAFRVGWVIRTALDLGFERIYFNIGSMTPAEIAVLGEWITQDEPVTMCVFQETYNRSTYGRVMGTDPSYPKADYDRRQESFEHWLDAGFRYVNPGVLMGLHSDLEEELIDLIDHAHRLANRNATVDLSLPRLRPAHGTRNASGVDDQAYLRLMATIAFTCPGQRIVLTTREEESFQKQAIDLCGVFSPGSPDVTPYRELDRARNELATSQFLVADLRRPRDILREIQATGRDVQHFAESPQLSVS